MLIPVAYRRVIAFSKGSPDFPLNDPSGYGRPRPYKAPLLMMQRREFSTAENVELFGDLLRAIALQLGYDLVVQPGAIDSLVQAFPSDDYVAVVALYSGPVAVQPTNLEAPTLRVYDPELSEEELAVATATTNFDEWPIPDPNYAPKKRTGPKPKSASKSRRS